LVFGIVAALILGCYIYVKSIVIQQERDAKVATLVHESLALDYLKEATAIMQSQLPIQFEDGSVLFDVKFDEVKREFTYFHLDKHLSSLPKSSLKEYESNIKSEKISTAKNSKNKFAFEDANVSMRYKIFDSAGNELIDFSISPEEMK